MTPVGQPDIKIFRGSGVIAARVAAGEKKNGAVAISPRPSPSFLRFVPRSTARDGIEHLTSRLESPIVPI